jgi:hypothetical protein
MRIKDGKGKKTELIFLIIAATLTVFLLAYLMWLVQHLVQKANNVFSITVQDTSGIPTFHFKRYDELFKTASSTPVKTPNAPVTASTTKQ